MPPPPKEALIIMGKPIFLATSRKFLPTTPSEPGVMGTPPLTAISRAVLFTPSMLMAWAVGPIKVMPALVTASAKSAFSDRKP